MALKEKTAITPTREEDYPQWYLNVIKAADMAENSDVRGCMVIKPWGYAIWENMQKHLDRMFKETGHVNAYFPIFIPKSYFEKEAEHVDGFAKECAVVTHSRLEADGQGGLQPAGELAEPYIVRPTSETIIGASFARWINSYRDLPMLINQWANIVRWELRTRLFLRTAEFLWQEGHTAHASEEEAYEETFRMLNVYSTFAHDYLALPVIMGEKTESEKFPGAVNTYCIEAMMQDRKALQSGTSHFLGQNFAKASEIKFQDRDGYEKFAWTTSWGVSTRLVGALIMGHSDDNGLVLPPRVAPVHVVAIPIYKNDEEHQAVLQFLKGIAEEVKQLRYHDEKIVFEIDDRDFTGSDRAWQWIKKGVPVRIEVGPRDLREGSVFMGRRDMGPKDKISLPAQAFVGGLCDLLDEIQANILARATEYRNANSLKMDDKAEFYRHFTPQNEEKPEIHGGFVYAHWCGDPACEEAIKSDLKVTIRCIPLEAPEEDGHCIHCGRPSKKRVLFAKNY